MNTFWKGVIHFFVVALVTGLGWFITNSSYASITAGAMASAIVRWLEALSV